MKVLFAGLGSIGCRHLRNLKRILDEQGEPLTAHALRASKRALPADVAALLAQSFDSFDALPGGYDAAFVTNPTSLHPETVRALAPRARALFIEKPLAADASLELASLGLREGGVYYVACPLRYKSAVQRVIALARQKQVFAVRAVCSSYLPEWRPGTDYRLCYSAKRAEGGGVSRDLIHEWDYLTAMLGMPDEVRRFAGHLSPLEVDSDDAAVYIARFPHTLLTLQLDYIGRAPVRQAALTCADETVVVDILANTVTHLPSGETERFPADEDFYGNEMRHFLACVRSGRADTGNDPAHALEVLKIALTGEETI